MRNRQEQIHSKGFNIVETRQSYEGPVDYNKLKVGAKTLSDASLNLGALPKIRRQYCNKEFILKGLAEKDVPMIREISDYFYSVNGIYAKVCDYAAHLYRYDWYIVPEILDETVKNEKVLKEFTTLLDYFDASHIQKMCGDIALKVIKNGAYYACVIDTSDGLILQELPPNYCRCLYQQGASTPLVELNMKFFDNQFTNATYRAKILKMFPQDVQKGYVLYKTGKLPPDDVWGQAGSWYPLDPGTAIRFNLNDNNMPLFANAIPAIIDLDQAQDLDRRKQMQDLLKIVIQKLPIDKNGDLIFDVDEARDIHNNAVEMLEHAIGVDVLTTFADINVEDMSDSNTTSSTDDLERVERTVYNSLGISQNLFNTDSNLGMTYSVNNDAASMRNLLLQFHIFFDNICRKHSLNKRKWCFRLYMLETTQYNYQDLAKMYKEQVQIGYSKMLPQIAMGHSQSSIIHTAYFENEVLNLSELMIPPLQSSVMSAENMQVLKGQSTTGASGSSSSDSGTVGRPEKSETEKSDKTIANQESM